MMRGKRTIRVGPKRKKECLLGESSDCVRMEQPMSKFSSVAIEISVC